MKLVLLGPPGAGKGTQAKRVADRYNVKHISTGEMFREAIANGSGLGQKLQSRLDAGGLAPDDVVIKMVLDRIARDDCAEGWMLDGFPRNIAQARALEMALAAQGTELDAVLEIRVDEDEVVKRLSGRRTCAGCGKIYHTEFLPPKVDGICDDCGGELKRRADDHEESIRERLKEYHAQTELLTPFFEAEGKLKAVVGTGKHPDEVTAQILDVLG